MAPRRPAAARAAAVQADRAAADIVLNLLLSGEDVEFVLPDASRPSPAWWESRFGGADASAEDPSE